MGANQLIIFVSLVLNTFRFYRMKETELIALLRLQAVPLVGDILAKKLLQKFGSAENLFQTSKKDLQAVGGFGEMRLRNFFDTAYLKSAEEEYQYIQQKKITCHYFEDPDYPELLKQCIDGPVLLFQQGNIQLKNRLTLSIVGTRKATVHGTGFVRDLIAKLAPLNPVIISGFAFGIDIAAHKAALDQQLQTIGCMAHGLDAFYPKEHQKYRAQVLENGGFMSDFWHNATFDRNNFLRRNRIIAGLSEATLVVESAAKGGALVTADIAHSYDREIFAVPGRPGDQMSTGCNNLIKTQKAQAVTCAEDIIYFLGWDIPQKSVDQPQLFVPLNPEEKAIVIALKKLGKAELDDLAFESKLPTYKVASHLLNLELNNLIRPLPGKQYEAI